MTQHKPTVTGTSHTLPFDKLSPRDFERLCLWLVRREGYERAEHLGAAGSEQGRDIVAWREGRLWAFQCKRVQHFGPRDALAEVEKILALPQNERPAALMFLVTCDVSANTRQQVRDRCAREMECYFWTGTELDEKVKCHPDILEEFFQGEPGGTAITGDANVMGDGSTAIKVEAGEGAQVAVTVQGEDVRGKELDYLDVLLRRYEHWRDHYTPLAGIAEVRAAVEDGPRLDLPMPFVPREFEKLEEHGFGGRVEVRRERVDDLRTAVAEHRRIILLGDPGSGKTTTLWRLAYDYATAARDDGRAPLPVLVPLGGYTDDGPFGAYLARHLGPLAPYLETYHASGRLILLLDGLNEMPQAGYPERVGRIRDALDRCPDEAVVVTCRALDYVVELERLQKVEVSPLDDTRICAFLHNYLGQAAGERLFWIMAGDRVRDLWDTWRGAGGTWAEFWTAGEMPKNVYQETSGTQDRLWERLRKEPPPLLALGRNPYLLLVTAQVYAGAGGELPANRARLFSAFVDLLLGREEKRHPEGWIGAERQKDGLAGLAYAMQAERGRGTTVERAWAVDQLCRAAPGCDADRLLYLATSATLLDADDATVRFYHQLLQEYFAAREMGQRVAAGEPLDRYWPSDRWWEPSGWEETAILMAGMEPDASALLEKLRPVKPVVAARCLVEGGAQADEATRHGITMTLVAKMTDEGLPPVARAQAGDALARLGDPRPGVGLTSPPLLAGEGSWVGTVPPPLLAGEGLGVGALPDIAWCQVPAGPFPMGSTAEDELAYSDEKPQHTYEIQQPYAISRYPVTNAQYVAFVRAGGYGERRYWTEAGWAWREDGDITGSEEYGAPYNLPNHPVVGVSWYEAVAFCCWLTEELRRENELTESQEITLPTEPQWEKAARGTDGWLYPWGNDPDPEKANYHDTGIGATSAVGCFPGGASPYGVEDLSGNVWEWCRTKWQGSYEQYQPDSGLSGNDRRVLRGGAFVGSAWFVRCAYRLGDDPDLRVRDYGFRLVLSPYL
jgi:formylglycine-generating enzyme required for sulfatase activity